MADPHEALPPELIDQLMDYITHQIDTITPDMEGLTRTQIAALGVMSMFNGASWALTMDVDPPPAFPEGTGDRVYLDQDFRRQLAATYRASAQRLLAMVAGDAP